MAVQEVLVSPAGPPPAARALAGVMQVLQLAGKLLLVGWVLVALAVVLFSFGPSLFGYQALIVRSGSMEPAIPTGSVVVDQPVPPNTLQVGDVITFETHDGGVSVVTHRIAEITEAGPSPVFRTKGDANTTIDPTYVRYVNVGWKVIAVVPKAGYLFNALAQPAARGVLIGVPALLLTVSFLRDIWRPRR